MDILHKAKSQVKSLGRGVLSVAGLDGAWTQRSTTLQVKSCPPPSASVTAKYGIRHGYLQKKNEQGTFHRRFCVLVPHLFMYYYDNDSSETPRGIIDLDFYTDTAEDGRLGFHVAAEESHFREFYFQVEDEQDLNPWMAAINRDRYHVIKEERNAYMELQETFMSEQAKIDKLLEQERSAASRLKRRLDDINALNVALIQEVNAMLMKVGEKEEDTKHFEWTPKFVSELGNKFGEALDRMKADSVAQKQRQTAALEEKDDIIHSLEAQLADLNTRLSSQSEALAAMAINLDEHSEVVQRVKAERDDAVSNLDVVLLEKKQYVAKATELSEQRRALVKEVKALRKQAAEDKVSNAQLSQVNQEMAVAYEQLLLNFRELQAQHATLKKAASAELPPSMQKPTVEIPTLSPDVLSAAKDGTGLPASNASPVSPNDGSVKYRDLLTGEVRRNSSGEPIPAATAAALAASASGDDLASASDSHSLSNLMSSKFRAFKRDVKHIMKDKPADEALSSTPGSQHPSSGGGSGGMFKDLFTSIPTTGSKQQQGSLGSALQDTPKARRGSETMKAVDGDDLSSEHGDASTTSAQTCRRCGGSVEGPQYSTCTCPEPLLFDGEEDRGIGIKNFFTKSKMKFSSLFNNDQEGGPTGGEASDHLSSEHPHISGSVGSPTASSAAAASAPAAKSGPNSTPRAKPPVPLLDLDAESDDGSDDSIEQVTAKQVRMDAIFLR